MVHVSLSLTYSEINLQWSNGSFTATIFVGSVWNWRVSVFKNWPKQTDMQDSAAQNSYWQTIRLVRFTDSSAPKKIIEWPTVRTRCNKEERRRAKRFLCIWMTFSQSLTVSVGVSKLGYTGLIFVDPRVVKVAYYRYIILSQSLLPVIHQVDGNFVFQHDCLERPGHASFLTLIFDKIVYRVWGVARSLMINWSILMWIYYAVCVSVIEF